MRINQAEASRRATFVARAAASLIIGVNNDSFPVIIYKSNACRITWRKSLQISTGWTHEPGGKRSLLYRLHDYLLPSWSLSGAKQKSKQSEHGALRKKAFWISHSSCMLYLTQAQSSSYHLSLLRGTRFCTHEQLL